MSTFMAKPAEVQRKWYIIDAANRPLGRTATKVADILRGKLKPEFTPHVDCGDYVIIVNAEKIALTGAKWQKKEYVRHSGHPGGLKVRTATEMLEKQPQKIVEKAVRGMLPKGKLGDDMYRRLFVYVGPDHKQAAQKPEPFPVVK